MDRVNPVPSGQFGAHSPQMLGIAALVALFVFLHGVWLITVPGDLDAFNYVLGVRAFDVVQHRPHPPGAPVFVVAGKVSAWLWRVSGLPADGLAGHEPAALAGLSLVAGALTIVLAWRILTLLACPPTRTFVVTLLIGSAPLLWIASARHLSDAMGLVAALITLKLALRGRLAAAAALAGVAMGLRLQTALLTIPALLIVAACDRRLRTVVVAGGWILLGITAWLLPLLAHTGGAALYLETVTNQATDDLSSAIILAATPTLDNAAHALFNTFIRPWGSVALALLIVVVAVAGAIRLRQTAPRRATVLLLCAMPYLVFHIVFQETATVRYALPIVTAVAYLAGIGIEPLPARWRALCAGVLIAMNLLVAVRTLYAFSRADPPAIALLKAMHVRAEHEIPAFVTAHADLKLPRLQEILAEPAPWTTRAPEEFYEWLTVAEHWRHGGTAPVWFVANPNRTDLSLFDRRSQRVLERFQLDARAEWTVHGLRPKALAWREFRAPAWMALKGFALTPEVGGLAARDGDGPATTGATALVRRSDRGGVLVVGGRHVGSSTDPEVVITIEIDGRPVRVLFANPRARHYGALIHLSRDQLLGEGPYATVTIRSAAVGAPILVPVRVEQFDYQPRDGVLFAFTSGWHEPEIKEGTAQTWRWASRRARLLVHRAPGVDVQLRLTGAMPARWRTRPPRLVVTAGDRTLDTFTSRSTFSRRITIPAAHGPSCDIEVTLESTYWMVPRDEGQSADPRELAFRAFRLEADRLVPP